MPINPALALQVKGLELPDPMAQMAQATQIQNALQQQRMGDIQMQNALRQQQRAQGLEKLMSGFAPDAKTEDMASALTRGGYFNEAQTLVKSRAELEKERRQAEEAQRRAEEARLKNVVSQMDIVGRIYGAARDQASHEFAIDRLTKANVWTPEDIAFVGRNYDPSRQELILNMTRTQQQRIEEELKKRQTAAQEATASAAQSRAMTAAAQAAQDRTPAGIREFEAFKRMSPDEQAAFTAFQASKRPTTTVTTNMPPGESAFARSVGEGLAKPVVQDIEAARSATGVATRANNILSAVESNRAFMGPAADFKLQLARALNVTGKGPSEQIAATETLIADLKQSVIDAIKASNLGTGNGFTNKDLQFLVDAKAADIAKDPRTLQEFAERAYKTAEEATRRGNVRLSDKQQGYEQIRSQVGLDKFEIPGMVQVSPRSRSSVRRGEALSANNAIPKSYTGDPALWQYMSPEDRALWK